VYENIPTSTDWLAKENEPPEIFVARLKLQLKEWSDTVRRHGNCYMVKFGAEDIRPMWEDQINIGELARAIEQPAFTVLDCPLCQPYDLSGERNYLTRIIHPKYPEGFVDKTGVWIKCACLTKGESRKYLKFKGRREQKEVQ